MKEKFKKQSKIILILIIGIIIGVSSVSAATILFNSNAVGFDNTNANLTLNNTTVDNVQDAIDAIYQMVPAKCTTSPFKIGDYVEFTPTSTSFTPDTTLTGLDDYDSENGNPAGTTTVAGTLNPSYLNLWRVIKINSDCTVEVVSEYVSDVNVKFAGKVGYANLVYYLNEIAKQYANTTYTLDPTTAPDGAFRNVGYDHQTKQITNMSKITSTTDPWGGARTGPKTDEALGGGDFGFVTDIQLMEEANVPIIAYKKGSTVTESYDNYTSYWLASRLFNSYGSSWDFYARFMSDYGYVDYVGLYYRYSGSFRPYANSYAVRPIVTLKSGLRPTSGNGTISSHYTFS